MAFELRDYQKDAIAEVEANLMFDTQTVVGMSMGGGKSAIISHLSLDYATAGNTVVVLTNITALIPQLARHLDEFGVTYNVVKAGSHSFEKDAKVWLIMEQSFHENKRKELNIDCDILIKDEFHIGKGQKRYEDIKKSLNPNWVVGLSGTPYNEKGYLMHGVEPDQIITHGNAAELTEKGYLAPIKYYVPKWSEKVDYSEVSSSGNDYSGKDLDNIIDTDHHTGMIIKSMDEMNAKNKKTLVYASSIEHAETLTEALVKSGYSAEMVHSKLDSAHNEMAVNHFKDDFQSSGRSLFGADGQKECNCLVSVSQLTVGFDAPAAELLVLCRPTKVLRLYLQIAGRVARTFPGKKHAEILDLAQCIKEHGFFTDNRPFIKEGDKKGLAKAKEEAGTEVIVNIANEEPTEITRDLIDLKVEELLQKAKNVPSMTMEELIGFYEATNDTRTIIQIASEIGLRTKGIQYTSNTVDWINSTWITMLEEFPDYKSRLIKTLKTMAKNKIRDNKKMSALHYVVKAPDGWLRQQTPYSYAQEMESFVVEDDDIPF